MSNYPVPQHIQPQDVSGAFTKNVDELRAHKGYDKMVCFLMMTVVPQKDGSDRHQIQIVGAGNEGDHMMMVVSIIKHFMEAQARMKDAHHEANIPDPLHSVDDLEGLSALAESLMEKFKHAAP